MSGWDQLKPDALNANRGTERGEYALRKSLEANGPAGAITVDGDGNIIGGNKTAVVAAEMGLEPLLVKVKPHQMLVVQREDLDLYSKDDAKARDLATALNRVAELNLDWSDAMLEAAEEMYGTTARDDYWFADELVALAEAEEAREAAAAADDDEPTEPKPRQVPRFQVTARCKDENEMADLTEWLDSRGIAWK